MIDITKAKEFYKQYINRYNPEEPRIALKIGHIYRTAEKAKWLAQKLNLAQEDILLAELIGLLHDIGRFEQVKTYNTFVDHISVNHAEYGVKVLFEDNLIRDFIEDNKYDNIIRKAVANHNKDIIDSNIIDERELLHCRIIRDADKLDIYNVILNDKLESAYPLDRYQKENICTEIKDEFINNHKINYSNIKTCADVLVGHMAYVFDINYLYSIEEANQNNYINKIINKYGAQEKETIDDLAELNQIAQQYINEKIEEGNICLRNY